MDVLALILACSVYPDDALVRAMVELASQGNPTFVGDVTTLSTFDKSASVNDAERIVSELNRQGGRPVIGLLGLPPAWAQRYGRSRSELYDGCINLWVGTAVLAGHHDACVAAHAAMIVPTASNAKSQAAPSGAGGSGAAAGRERKQRVAPPEAIRLCALRRFGNEIGVDGYAEAVTRLLPQQRLLFSPAATPVGSGWSPVENSCRCQDDCSGAGPSWISYPKPRPHLPGLLPPGGAPILD